MTSAALSAPTVRYLFASSWAPAGAGAWTTRVPGATVDGPGTAGNLLNLGLWSLGEQGVIELEQVRPVQRESMVVLGGKSFARFAILDTTAHRAGLEGALIAAAQRARPLAVDRDDGLRSLLLALDLHDRGPWDTVIGHCFTEAARLGLVGSKGRVFRKTVALDPAGIEAFRERDAEIVAGRTEYRASHADLDGAVIADCFAALNWAHSTGG